MNLKVEIKNCNSVIKDKDTGKDTAINYNVCVVTIGSDTFVVVPKKAEHLDWFKARMREYNDKKVL